jgi:uncharacterized protein (DUF2235 family)
MPKNIVICCDGTGNDFNKPETDSNVVKLYNTLQICDQQIAYYHPGVGTLGAPNVDGRLAKWWSKVLGLAIGQGLLDIVGDAYRYLMNTYQEGDNIFIFGFSRGAYTARAVGSLLHVFGLLEPGNEQLIPYILRMYAQKSKAAQESTIPAENAFKYAFSRAVEVHFCGVWDTVSSYGWLTSPINLRFNGQNPIVRTGRHAVSIHEHRCFYQDDLWGPALAASEEGPAQDIRQVWFSWSALRHWRELRRKRGGAVEDHLRVDAGGSESSRDCWSMTSGPRSCWARLRRRRRCRNTWSPIPGACCMYRSSRFGGSRSAFREPGTGIFRFPWGGGGDRFLRDRTFTPRCHSAGKR